MSSNCQKIKVRTVSHTHTTSDITDFSSGVSAITLDVLNEYNIGVALSGEPLFVAWANSYSAQLIDTSNTVETNSAITWNYQGTDIKALTANWQSASTTVNSNSALWILSGGSVVETDPVFTSWAQTYSGNYQTSFNNLIANSAAYLTSNDLVAIQTTSANWNAVYSTVNVNSSVVWNYQGTDIKTLSGNWESVYNTVLNNSGTWVGILDNSEVNSFVNTTSADILLINSTVKNNSALWILSGGGSGPETDPIFNAWLATSAININSIYSTVNSNSAATWNYQGVDVKTLTANWQSTYSTVGSNSGSWNIDNDNAEVNAFVNANSANITLIDNTVKSNSALWILSGLSIETDPIFTSWSQTYSGNYQLIYNNIISNSAAYLTSTDLTLLSQTSGNWNNVYNTVNINSSVVWDYQGTDIKVLTSDWVNISTTVKSSSALWILSGGSVVETDPIFTSWLSTSANTINSVYSTVNSNSAITWNYQGTDIKALTANWQSASTTVNSNSSQWLINGGALGTPSSGTLTNCTSLPISGITSSTIAVLGVGSLELGHLTDTTISRISMGDVAVEGNRIYRSGGSFNGMPLEYSLAISDETTALTAGTAKVTFRMPLAMTLTAVRASVTTAPTGSTLVVDINQSGSTILSTKLSIDVSEKTSTTAATPAVISTSALTDDAEITIDIDQIGSTIAGTGLKITLIGTRV